MTRLILFIASFISIQCQSQTNSANDKINRQEAIIKEHVYDCADKINYTVMMKEYQDCLDAGLKKDSTIAYLWQQKAMPYYKIRKYSVGKEYLDKAVFYNEKRWLSYRGFMKCIFAKDYKGAIEDMELYIKKYGNHYEMDHTCAFYIGLSYLQLNEFSKAEKTFENDIKDQVKQKKEAHFLDWFYHGISLLEQQKFERAIASFDEALTVYPNFSEAQYYKSIAKAALGHSEDEIQFLYSEAIENRKKGYTITEDNAVYEIYPYQLRK
jgi:tetratricopeptide (TPR) repeat protein